MISTASIPENTSTVAYFGRWSFRYVDANGFRIVHLDDATAFLEHVIRDLPGDFEYHPSRVRGDRASKRRA